MLVSGTREAEADGGAVAAAYKVGDPFDPEVKVGPLINAAAVERVCGMLDRVRRDNAGRIALGGGRAGDDLADKNFVEPTVIVTPTPATRSRRPRSSARCC
jgi:aldehyde dehydrogenase (NAD+)